MALQYKYGVEEKWIDSLIKLHNSTDMKRSPELKEKFMRAFKNRYAFVTAWDSDQLVGCGSVISDGEMYSSIYDLVVHPNYQGRGIGRNIVEALLKKVPETCVHLTSTFGHEGFYEKIGFKKHKTAYGKYPWATDYLVEHETHEPEV